MRLPSGTVVESGLSLQGLNVKQKWSQLMDSGFSGYVALQIEGFDGLEEGLLLFRNRQMEGAIYEYLKFDVTVVGDMALTHCLNASGADFGVLDVVSLSNLQVDMAIAFDEKIKLSAPVDKKALERLSFASFEPGLAEKTLSAAVKQDGVGRNDLFKKFGLEDISSR